MRQVITRQPVMVGNTKIGDKELVVNQPVPEVNYNTNLLHTISYIVYISAIIIIITSLLQSTARRWPPPGYATRPDLPF